MNTANCKFLLLTGFFLGFYSSASAQSFLNGSFEITSASMGCNYNLANGTFNGMMSNVNAYGGGNECDILINGCYNSGIPNGVRAVGVAATPPNQDQIALALTAPLTAGNTYTLSFYSYSEISFRPQGNLDIGASTSNAAFGTLLYTATTVPSTWVSHSFTFVTPNNTTHITVRNVNDGIIHWNHVDHFRFTILLPIELLDFNALPLNDQTVKLDWETASEMNNDYFVVERTKDGVHWEEIVRKAGAGTSTSPLHYVDYDDNPLSGISYYRVKQVDFDGEFSYSEVKSVNMENSELSTLIAYPNPTENSITIEGTAAELSDLILYNMIGQDLSEKVEFVRESETRITIDLSLMPVGIYTLKTKTKALKVTKK